MDGIFIHMNSLGGTRVGTRANGTRAGGARANGTRASGTLVSEARMWPTVVSIGPQEGPKKGRSPGLYNCPH